MCIVDVSSLNQRRQLAANPLDPLFTVDGLDDG